MRPLHCLMAVAAGVLLAGPAAADWVYRTAGANADAAVTGGNRTLVVSCPGGISSISITPGPQRLGNEGTDLFFGFVVDGNEPGRINVPMECAATGCAQQLAPQAYGIPEATRLMANLRRGNTLQVWFRDRPIESFTLRGSSAALSSLESAPGACAGL